MRLDAAPVVLDHAAEMVFLLDHGDDLFSVDRHAAGDDLADIAAAKNHDAAADIQVIDVDHFLHLSGCVDANRSGSADA